ncbi:MAG: TrmH family RNA methyltransferase, partial [Bacteroidales bacterium]|nr:TrmH family RNA methyltransferase [Bacteroidales bacterium]
MPRKIPNRELCRLSPEEFRKSPRLPLVLVLDNVRSQHNIGSAFRTSDAFALEH